MKCPSCGHTESTVDKTTGSKTSVVIRTHTCKKCFFTWSSEQTYRLPDGVMDALIKNKFKNKGRDGK